MAEPRPAALPAPGAAVPAAPAPAGGGRVATVLLVLYAAAVVALAADRLLGLGFFPPRGDRAVLGLIENLRAGEEQGAPAPRDLARLERNLRRARLDPRPSDLEQRLAACAVAGAPAEEARRLAAETAADSLRRLKEADDFVAVPLLIAALDDSSPAVRRGCAAALRELTEQDFGADAAAWRKWWEEEERRAR